MINIEYTIPSIPPISRHMNIASPGTVNFEEESCRYQCSGIQKIEYVVKNIKLFF